MTSAAHRLVHSPISDALCRPQTSSGLAEKNSGSLWVQPSLWAQFGAEQVSHQTIPRACTTSCPFIARRNGWTLLGRSPLCYPIANPTAMIQRLDPAPFHIPGGASAFSALNPAPVPSFWKAFCAPQSAFAGRAASSTMPLAWPIAWARCLTSKPCCERATDEGFFARKSMDACWGLTSEKILVSLRPSKGAGVVKLVDTPDLGSGASACGFESLHPHFFEEKPAT